jgi:hypothetical protein
VNPADGANIDGMLLVLSPVSIEVNIGLLGGRGVVAYESIAREGFSNTSVIHHTLVDHFVEIMR